MKVGYSTPPRPVVDLSSTRIVLLTTQWNPDIVAALVAGARRRLADWSIADTRVKELQVPGAYEMPLACAELFARDACDAIITLGAVIRGDTPHFDFVAGECARGLMDVQLRYLRPIGFGVLTVNTLEQALVRSGPGDDNKGCEATAAALQMIAFARALPR